MLFTFQSVPKKLLTTNKMAENLALPLKENERLAEAARELTCLCGKSKNEYKYEYVVENAWKQVAGEFEFVSANKTTFLDILLYDSL